jgi:DNA-binding NarL/FixJ family response regulator
MNKEQTLRILNALANGIHPATGEKFGADTPYQHPDTVRALFEAMRAVEGAGEAAPASSASTSAAPAAERRPAMPESGSGSRWTSEEEQRLVNSFDTGRTVDELARAHNRSRAAIEARLVRLGKMAASAVTSPLRYPPKAGGGQARQGT